MQTPYPELSQGLVDPAGFVTQTFAEDERWRPAVRDLNAFGFRPETAEFLSHVGLPSSDVPEIYDIGMGFSREQRVTPLAQLLPAASDPWRLGERIHGMICLKHEPETYICVSSLDNEAVMMLTSGLAPGAYLVNSGVQHLAVALAAFLKHMHFTYRLAREEIAEWDEEFYTFLHTLDPPAYGAGETYWSRVREFLEFR